ncbi:hypothetical protein PLESTB_000766500 [Pleodorina starrii]|uniref:Ammonium transporter n=1 Tax=Pleodorina starrii TaxID=330485 RepID=A0A9W6F295_9CHLO|nr:hypothetical protein PLESTB_000766500 [Pleodorina starrii]GLC65711.1 hypothetical protein PLESTF_000331800 [Pleodorina starrii]
MLAAGAIRSKNAVNILLQTLMDACASAIMWYLVGFGFAFGIGDKPNAFIGDALFGLARLSSHNTGSGTGRWLDVVFQWAFCATAVTIPAGSVAERCNFNAYLCYSTFISAWLYPLLAHWVWCPKGWLGYGTQSPLLRTGMIDFAGSAVVHMTGGLSGLAGAVMLGPRMGRFDAEGQPLPLPGHSAVLVVLGTILLWFGWYGFNPVSTLFIDTAAAAEVAARSAVTTTLAGAAGGVGCLAWTLLRTRTFDLYALCNGVLCGFVAVTAGCHVYEPWAAVICGAGAGIIFDLACILLLKLKIDDPLGAAPMHGGCGAYGTLFAGLLAKKGYIVQSYTRVSYPYGLFYGGGGRLLACQVIGVLTIAGWTLAWMMPFFWVLKRLNLLRVPPEEELQGLDMSRHFSRAYYMEADSYNKPLVSQITTSYSSPGAIVITAAGAAMGTPAGAAAAGGSSSPAGDAAMRSLELAPQTAAAWSTSFPAQPKAAEAAAWGAEQGQPRAESPLVETPFQQALPVKLAAGFGRDVGGALLVQSPRGVVGDKQQKQQPQQQEVEGLDGGQEGEGGNNDSSDEVIPF